jgi:hypothetical protein
MHAKDAKSATMQDKYVMHHVRLWGQSVCP